MKFKFRGTSFLAALNVLAGPSSSLADNVDGFQGFAWGTDRKDIIAALGPPARVYPDTAVIGYAGAIIYYEQSVANFPASIIFFFEPGCSAAMSATCKLSEVNISFDSPTPSSSLWLRQALTKEYGEPIRIRKASISFPDGVGEAEGTKYTWRSETSECELTEHLVVSPYYRFWIGDISLLHITYMGPYALQKRMEETMRKMEKREREETNGG